MNVNNECQKTPNFEAACQETCGHVLPSKVWNFNSKQTGIFQRSGTPFRSRLGILKVKQTFNFEGGLYLKEASVFDSRFKIRGWIPRRNIEGLECYRTSKICGFQMPSEHPWLSGRIIDEILKLPNTTGLNFEDSASECNFEGPRLPECLMDRISEVCGFIVPHGRNFKGK
ncbi:hypothetical protein RclHR1_06510006 [Rhizophagus clarus]|uniref:Uncharacterized protein n=1 Tax=Rhizophagus clarus TaxID=94130 RepID=A0A2Z6SJ21_9GLOM|nr:hypothetical protein RclHR1_06510006 [Rhizophagus clarus]